jgi:general stress protein 26
MDEIIKKEILDLVSHTKNAFVSSLDSKGYPNTKAMFALKQDGVSCFYFSTNYSAKRTQQFLANPKSCVYLCDQENICGLMLTGEMQVCKDREHKTMLWRDGFEIYYPKGIEDEDYCVLKFTAIAGNYYHGLKNVSFSVDSL